MSSNAPVGGKGKGGGIHYQEEEVPSIAKPFSMSCLVSGSMLVTICKLPRPFITPSLSYHTQFLSILELIKENEKMKIYKTRFEMEIKIRTELSADFFIPSLLLLPSYRLLLSAVKW